jgi:hypothetical protein
MLKDDEFGWSVLLIGWSAVVTIVEQLIVENDVEKWTVHLQRIASVIINEPQFPKSVHEKAHPWASCTHHLC